MRRTSFSENLGRPIFREVGGVAPLFLNFLDGLLVPIELGEYLRRGKHLEDSGAGRGHDDTLYRGPTSTER